MKVVKVRKAPVVVEAVQWLDATADDIVGWVNGNGGDASYDPETAGPPAPDGGDWGRLEVHTLEGTMVVAPHDHVIRGIKGEFYPCKPDIYAQTYVDEPVVPLVVEVAGGVLLGPYPNWEAAVAAMSGEFTGWRARPLLGIEDL